MAYNNANNRNFNGNNGFKFINFTLLRADEKALKEWRNTLEEVEFDAILSAILLRNYKVSFSIDHENNAFTVVIIGTDKSINPNMGMSSKAGTAYEALLISLYKLDVVFESGVWSNVYTQSGGWG